MSLGAHVLHPPPLCVQEWVTSGLGVQVGMGSTWACPPAPGTPTGLPWRVPPSLPAMSHLPILLRWQQLCLYKKAQRQSQQEGHRTWPVFWEKYTNLQEK